MCKIDKETIASGSHDKTVKIWKVQDGKVAKILDDNKEGSIISVIYMKEINCLITAGYDRIIRIYDGKTFFLKKQIENSHNDCIISLT